jgi:DNA-binding response OmpR family regulator
VAKAAGGSESEKFFKETPVKAEFFNFFVPPPRRRIFWEPISETFIAGGFRRAAAQLWRFCVFWFAAALAERNRGRDTELLNRGDGMARILVVEDELKIQQIVRAYLEKEGFEVVTAADGLKALEAAKASRPDLIVLDLMLPGLPGEEVLSRLRQTSDVPVIILSAKSSEDERIFGLNIGADDYLIKPFSPRELVARVLAHLRRSKPAGASRETRLSFNGGRLAILPDQHQVLREEQAVNLTPTEFKMLLLLAQAPGRVFSRAQLLEQAQGYSFEGYDRTVDSHIKNLRQKIEPNPNEPLFIQTVFGVGYKFGGSRDAIGDS